MSDVVFKAGVSRRWTKRFAKSVQRVTLLQNKLAREVTADMDAEARNALLDAKDDAINQIDALSDEQASMIAEVVEDVPREWLVDGAPDDLDWNEPESYDWMTQAKYNELVMSVMTGEAFRESAKN